MESAITSLNTPSIMRHCTVAPLSADVALSMVMMDGLGPEEVSGDVILSMSLFRAVPNCSVVVIPGRLIRVQTNSPTSVELQ